MLCALLTALALATPGPSSASATLPAVHPPALAATSWPLNEPHLLLRSFEAPPTPYSAGHRGIDISATPGQPVYAVAAGTVSFAGTVVDRPLVSITHAGAPPAIAGGSLISTVEPVTPSVAVGDTVAAGQQIGVVATSAHCSLACLHLGVRLNGAYVSPLLLLGGLRRPVLLPLTGTTG